MLDKEGLGRSGQVCHGLVEKDNKLLAVQFRQEVNVRDGNAINCSFIGSHNVLLLPATAAYPMAIVVARNRRQPSGETVWIG